MLLFFFVCVLKRGDLRFADRQRKAVNRALRIKSSISTTQYKYKLLLDVCVCDDRGGRLEDGRPVVAVVVEPDIKALRPTRVFSLIHRTVAFT